MFGSSIVQLVSSIMAALITGTALIITQLLKNKRVSVLWIIIFMVLGALGGYYLGETLAQSLEFKITDDFSNKSRYWDQANIETASHKSKSYIVNGKYYWEVTGFDLVGATIEPATPILSNFIYSIDIKQIKGSDDITYGILFRSNEASGWYFFAIRNDGYFQLMFSPPSGEMKWLIPWTKSSVISNKNNLKVIAQEDVIRLYINNSLVTSISDRSSTYGEIGIYVGVREGDNTAFEIDNFDLEILK